MIRLRTAARRAKSTKKANKIKAVSLPLGEGAEGAVLSRGKFVKTVAKAVMKTARKKAARTQASAELPLGTPSALDDLPIVAAKIKRKRSKPVITLAATDPATKKEASDT